MQQGGCSTQRRTFTTLDGSQECESLNQMCFGLERKASIFLCRREEHTQKDVQKKKTKQKKRTTTIPIAGGKRQTSLWNGGRFGQLGRTGLAFRAKSLLLYLHVQTEMAPKSRAWQSFSSDQWQAYQNIYMLCSTAEDVKAWAKLSDYKDFKCT